MGMWCFLPLCGTRGDEQANDHFDKELLPGKVAAVHQAVENVLVQGLIHSNLEEKFPERVKIVKFFTDDKSASTVVLVGTNHIDIQSALTAKQVVAEYRPTALVLEL